MSADDSDRDLVAAEYVLGTLDAGERAAFAASLPGDAIARAAVRAWELRLGPLSLAVPEQAPGPQVWQGIAQALAETRPAAANDNRIAALSRQVGRWRMAAAGAGLVAAGLALVLSAGIRPSVPPGPAPARYLAVVTSGGEAPALIVSIDTVSGIAQVRPVGAQAPAGKSLELWYVGTGGTPKALGVLGSDAARLSLPVGTAQTGEGLFAVSVEPPGGSPTGQPTGPVIYTGKLIRE